jgi:signal peptidase I
MSVAVETDGRPAIQVPDRAGGARENVSSARASSAGQHRHHHSFLEAFQSLLYVIVIALFLMTFTVQPFRIPSESMEPTLLVGDFLLVNKEIGREMRPRVFAPTSEIRRGDLIVFHYPVDPSLHLVKRVIGLPGDRVRLRGGRASGRRRQTVTATNFRGWRARTRTWIRDGGSRCARWSRAGS